jgi:hypothetical protein
MLLVPLFLALFLVVRGTPVFLYRNDIAKGQRLSFALYAATALPMVVAITEVSRLAILQGLVRLRVLALRLREG